ncbi:uncharacterized protein METZ01_LOCUS354365, partial [marine metagenome]
RRATIWTLWHRTRGSLTQAEFTDSLADSVLFRRVV